MSVCRCGPLWLLYVPWSIKNTYNQPREASVKFLKLCFSDLSRLQASEKPRQLCKSRSIHLHHPQLRRFFDRSLSDAVDQPCGVLGCSAWGILSISLEIWTLFLPLETWGMGGGGAFCDVINNAYILFPSASFGHCLLPPTPSSNPPTKVPRYVRKYVKVVYIHPQQENLIAYHPAAHSPSTHFAHVLHADSRFSQLTLNLGCCNGRHGIGPLLLTRLRTITREKRFTQAETGIQPLVLT